MKLPGIASTVQRPTRDSVERVPHANDERIRRVESMDGVESDRQRSLRQEVDEIEAAAIGDFSGQEQVLHEASAVAAQLLALGSAADALIRADDVPRMLVPNVDASA